MNTIVQATWRGEARCGLAWSGLVRRDEVGFGAAGTRVLRCGGNVVRLG